VEHIKICAKNETNYSYVEGALLSGSSAKGRIIHQAFIHWAIKHGKYKTELATY